jgi:hypothetical protein
MTIDSSTISDNQAPINGAGIRVANGNLMVTNSTISGNAAGSLGGGIFQNGGHVWLTNVTVAGNSALIGGGFGKEAGEAQFIHVTVAGNSANTYSGIYSLTDRPNVLLVNTIVANNNGDRTQCGSFGTPAIADGSNNLVYPAASPCVGIGRPHRRSEARIALLNAPGVTATGTGAGVRRSTRCRFETIARHRTSAASPGRRGSMRHRRVRGGAIVRRDATRHPRRIDGTLGSDGWYRSDVM